MLKLNDPTLLKDACLVNGAWVQATSGDVTEVTNPATGAVVGTVPTMSPDEIPAVIEASRVAQLDWAQWAAAERSAVLRKWFELMMANADDLALIMTSEQGKPLAEAKAP